MERAVKRDEGNFTPDSTQLVPLLADMLAMKQGALRDLAQALQVASDALQPLADRRPVSGPAQRALVTIALVSLGQAAEALVELEIIAGETGAGSLRRQLEPEQ